MPIQTENVASILWEFLQKHPETMVHFTCVPSEGEMTGLISTRIDKWYLNEEHNLLHGEGTEGRVIILLANLIACEENNGALSVAYAGTYLRPEPDSALWMFVFEPC